MICEWISRQDTKYVALTEPCFQYTSLSIITYKLLLVKHTTALNHTKSFG